MMVPLAPPRPAPRLAAALTAAVLAAVLVAAAILATSSAHAEDGDISWSVQPAGADGADGRETLDYTVAPGTRLSDSVAVTNYSGTPATFRVYAADAVTDFESASFTLIGEQSLSTDLGSWIAVGDSDPGCGLDRSLASEEELTACAAAIGVTITLEPNTSATVPVTITVPHDASPGDHAAGIVAAVRQERGDGSGLALSQRTGTRVYLRVDGPLAPGFAVHGAVLSHGGTWNPFAPGTARVAHEIANTGNTRLSVSPTVTLTGPFGIPLAEVTADTVHDILPGGTALVEQQLTETPPLLLLFADITAEAVPASGAGGADALPPPATSRAIGWAVPWSLLGAVTLLALVVWLVLWRRRSNRERLALALGDYTEQLRAETLAQAGLAPEPHAGPTAPAHAPASPQEKEISQ